MACIGVGASQTGNYQGLRQSLLFGEAGLVNGGARRRDIPLRITDTIQAILAARMDRSHGERASAAELRQLAGELLLAQEGRWQNLMEAEACSDQTLDIARRQSAKLLEPCGTMRLSRLCKQRGTSMVEAPSA